MEWKNHTEVSSNITNSSDAKNPSLTVGICGLMLFLFIVVILFLMLFVYRTYKTTPQRLIVYYVILSLCFTFSEALKFVGAFIMIHGRWVCNIIRYLIISSEIAWYTYITVIANLSLFLTIYLTRTRGKPLSKQNNLRRVECICVISAVVIGLTVASVVEICNHSLNLECVVVSSSANRSSHSKFWIVYSSIYLGMDLEVILVSFCLFVFFCFICQRIRNRKTAILLRNSVINVAANASIMGLDSVRVGYNFIHEWSTLTPHGPTDFNVSTYIQIFDVIFILAISIAVLIQAVLCIQTSTERNACCIRGIVVYRMKRINSMPLLMDRHRTQLPTQLLVVSVHLAIPTLMFPTLEDLLKSLQVHDCQADRARDPY